MITAEKAFTCDADFQSFFHTSAHTIYIEYKQMFIVQNVSKLIMFYLHCVYHPKYFCIIFCATIFMVIMENAVICSTLFSFV